MERHNNRCCCGSGWEPHLPVYTMNICVVISDHLTKRATPPTGSLLGSDWWVSAVKRLRSCNEICLRVLQEVTSGVHLMVLNGRSHPILLRFNPILLLSAGSDVLQVELLSGRFSKQQTHLESFQSWKLKKRVFMSHF